MPPKQHGKRGGRGRGRGRGNKHKHKHDAIVVVKTSSSPPSLFDVFDGVVAGPPGPGDATDGSLEYLGPDGDWTPSAPGTWYKSPFWDENDVFHAQLTSYRSSSEEGAMEKEKDEDEEEGGSGDDDVDVDVDDQHDEGGKKRGRRKKKKNKNKKEIEWTAKIGKGAQLYSLALPAAADDGAALELLPPQHTDVSAWTDDCFITTLYDGKQMDTDPKLEEFGMNYLQNGYYVKPFMDPILQKPFYEPVVAQLFDATDRSYSTVNVRFTSQPSVHRSDAIMYTKYRRVGSRGAVEATYYFYNFGEKDRPLTALTFPWGGVRTSVMPDHLKGNRDGSFENFGSASTGRYKVKDSGGWSGTAADHSDTDGTALGLVHGVDPPWAHNIFNTDPNRNFTVMATSANNVPVQPREGFFFRTYYVPGPALGDVAQDSADLVDSVDSGKVEFDQDSASSRLPLYRVTRDGQTVLSTTPEDSCAADVSVAESFSVPVAGSWPLILMREIESGTYVLSVDPYVVCSKTDFPNPFEKGDDKYKTYQNRVVRRPYDGRTEWVDLLGYALPSKKGKLQGEFQRLSSVLGGDILFAPGEKRRADDLMVWTGHPDDDPDGDDLFVFKKNGIIKGGKAKQGLIYQFQIPTSSSSQTAAPTTAADVSDESSCSSSSSSSSGNNDSSHRAPTDSGGLTFSKVLGPAWLKVSSDGLCTGVPGPMDDGLNTVSIRVVRSGGGLDVVTMKINVMTKVDLVVEFNSPGDPDWVFPTLPGPSSDAYTDSSKGNATITIPTDNPSSGGEVDVLFNGRGQRKNKDEDASVFFRSSGGVAPNRLLVDLGTPQSVSRVNVYSWTANGINGNHVYNIYYSEGDLPPPSSSGTRGADLIGCGWTRLVYIRTDVGKKKDLQLAVGLKKKWGEELMRARYLLWDLVDPKTRLGEIDVYTTDGSG